MVWVRKDDTNSPTTIVAKDFRVAYITNGSASPERVSVSTNTIKK